MHVRSPYYNIGVTFVPYVRVGQVIFFFFLIFFPPRPHPNRVFSRSYLLRTPRRSSLTSFKRLYERFRTYFRQSLSFALTLVAHPIFPLIAPAAPSPTLVRCLSRSPYCTRAVRRRSNAGYFPVRIESALTIFVQEVLGGVNKSFRNNEHSIDSENVRIIVRRRRICL